MSTTASFKCPTVEDLFSKVLVDTITDYHNAEFLRDIPHNIKVYFQNCLTQKIPDFFTHYTTELSTTGKKGAVDGIGTNPRTYPTLVALKNRNNITYMNSLPDANEVFTKLLLRTGPIKTGNGLNTVLSTFVNFFLEDFLFTKPNAAGSQLADSVRGLFLGGVYGVSAERAAMLRSGLNGKLRTSFTDQGDEVALMWKDVHDPSVTRPSPTTFPTTFVLGLDMFNRHWGHVFWASALTKLHNQLCDSLINEHLQQGTPSSLPSITDDEEIYSRVRVAMTNILFRFIFEDYISNTLANGLLKDKIRWKYDPIKDCSENGFRLTNKHLIELNHIYRWHNMVPSEFEYLPTSIGTGMSNGHTFTNNGTGEFEMVSLKEFSNSSTFTDYKLQEHFEAFYRTKAGLFTTNNVPEELRMPTVQTILAERRIGMGSFNDYIEAYGMKRLNSFEDLTFDKESAQAFAELYKSIDDVELVVGATVRPGSPISKEILAMLSATVLSGLYSDNHFCSIDKSYFTKDYLGDSLYSLSMEKDHVFASILHILFGFNSTMDTTPSTYTHETAIFTDMPSLWQVSFYNLNDYTGLNMLWESIVPDATFYGSFLSALVTAFAIIGTFGWIGRQFMIRAHNGWKEQSGQTQDSNIAVIHEYDVILFNIVTAIIYGVQMPGYCLGVGLLLFTSRFDIMAKEIWPYCITSLCVHMIMYVADVVIRFKHQKFNNYVFFHHLAYIATVVIAFWQKDIFSLKFVTLMDASLTCECGLYALMAYSKLHHRQLTWTWRQIGRWSVVFFIATRVIQTVLLFILFIQGYSRMIKYELGGLYAFDCIMATLITFVQCYTVHEYSKWKTLWMTSSNLNTSKWRVRNPTVKPKPVVVEEEDTSDRLMKAMTSSASSSSHSVEVGLLTENSAHLQLDEPSALYAEDILVGDAEAPAVDLHHSVGDW